MRRSGGEVLGWGALGIDGYGKGFTQFAQAVNQFWISLFDMI